MPLTSGAFNPADRVVVPVAGTDREFIAQQWAVELAASLGLSVHAVHVSPKDPEGDVFDYVTSLAEKWGVTLTTHVSLSDDVIAELVAELAPRDLAVIGTRRLGGHYHVGSVAAALVRNAPCPVQIVRIE